jgi:hypothetical protein
LTVDAVASYEVEGVDNEQEHWHKERNIGVVETASRREF